MNTRHLSPAETADALGITRRALRVYEQRGLVQPLRAGNGYRAYGPEALSRLHQVLALKRLGFTLAAIKVLLAGRLARLEDVLELQEAELARRRDDAERGLALVRAARARLGGGGVLTLDDLTTLTKETTMTDAIPDWARKMQPAIDRNFSEADKAAMAARAGDYDQAKVQAEWDELIAEAKSLVGTDPGSPEAADLARRWRAQVNLATGGDPEVFAKVGAVWRESMADPKAAHSLPFGPEVMAFVGQATARLDA